MRMWQEFKAFVNKGNVLDLAVGVIIGAAFGKIITSFTDDLLMPVIGLATGGGVDFSNKFILLGDPGDKVITTLAEAKAAGIGAFAYGSFITALINFLIMAFVIFMIVRQANKMMKRSDEDATPEQVLLLREIRDNLKK
ncbi:large conductance mechanosensitive channel protein MscL [Chakrabartia godavariana]|nr:large conductance mechanosensitive channel protein MscL [Chakrabartia godavariana]